MRQCSSPVRRLPLQASNAGVPTVLSTCIASGRTYEVETLRCFRSQTCTMECRMNATLVGFMARVSEVCFSFYDHCTLPNHFHNPQRTFQRCTFQHHSLLLLSSPSLQRSHNTTVQRTFHFALTTRFKASSTTWAVKSQKRAVSAPNQTSSLILRKPW